MVDLKYFSSRYQFPYNLGSNRILIDYQVKPTVCRSSDQRKQGNNGENNNNNNNKGRKKMINWSWIATAVVKELIFFFEVLKIITTKNTEWERKSYGTTRDDARRREGKKAKQLISEGNKDKTAARRRNIYRSLNKKRKNKVCCLNSKRPSEAAFVLCFLLAFYHSCEGM